MSRLIPSSLLSVAAVVGLVVCQKLIGHRKTASPTDGSADVPQPDGKKLAETFLTPGNGIVALVFDEQGQAVVVTRDGRVLQPCRLPGQKTPSDAPICETLVDTTVQACLPITVLRHTGSQCMAFIINVDGQQFVYELCW